MEMSRKVVQKADALRAEIIDSAGFRLHDDKSRISCRGAAKATEANSRGRTVRIVKELKNHNVSSHKLLKNGKQICDQRCKERLGKFCSSRNRKNRKVPVGKQFTYIYHYSSNLATGQRAISKSLIESYPIMNVT